MKRLLLSSALLLLCFVSKAQQPTQKQKAELVKLHNNVIKYDKLYKQLMYEGMNGKDIDPDYLAKIDSMRIAAHDDYNDYWFNSHEDNADKQRKIIASLPVRFWVLWLP